MLEHYVIKSVNSIFIDAFNTDIMQCKNRPRKDEYTYNSSINIIKDNNPTKVYFGFKRATLVALISKYMFEDKPEEEIIVDFCGEMANLIVGKAKVFAQNDNLFVDIDTPIIEKSIPKKLSNIYYYKYNNLCFKIGVK